jgi:TRAF3-interacting protein 1
MSTLPELVKETKLMLGLLTDKPVLLQEDLLSRPPLRFLHDLISNVVKNTGYPAGLLDSADSDSKSVKVS